MQYLPLLGEGTNWQDEIFQNASMHNHQINISGGNDNVKYSISGGYLKQEGIAIGSELADVTAAYGDSSSDTKCEYVKGDSQLLILLENGVVTSIQYVAITE